VPKRFAVKKMQMLQDKTLYIKEKVLAILYWKVDMDEAVAEGGMSKEWVAKKLDEKFNSMIEPLVEVRSLNHPNAGTTAKANGNIPKQALDKITEQGILDELAIKDKNARSWTNEDPGLDKIKEWLAKNEQFDVDTEGEKPKPA
jgi:hypothetical protein